MRPHVWPTEAVLDGGPAVTKQEQFAHHDGDCVQIGNIVFDEDECLLNVIGQINAAHESVDIACDDLVEGIQKLPTEPEGKHVY